MEEWFIVLPSSSHDSKSGHTIRGNTFRAFKMDKSKLISVCPFSFLGKCVVYFFSMVLPFPSIVLKSGFEQAVTGHEANFTLN